MPETPDAADEKTRVSELLNELESQESVEKLEILIRRDEEEIILRNPKDGKVVKLTGRVYSDESSKEEESEEDDAPPVPLTPEEFEDGIRQLDAIGLTFDVDLLPRVLAKDETVDINPEVFDKIQRTFPSLPSEVGLVAHNTMTGTRFGIERLGGNEAFEKKSEIVQALLITDLYREQFFFRHALKLPYLESIDWEITIRKREKGVKSALSVPYAMLMLTLRDGNQSPDLAQRSFTVAVSRDLIDKHLAVLTEARTALDETFGNKTSKSKDEK
jgi:hypothetical protein